MALPVIIISSSSMALPVWRVCARPHSGTRTTHNTAVTAYRQVECFPPVLLGARLQLSLGDTLSTDCLELLLHSLQACRRAAQAAGNAAEWMMYETAGAWWQQLRLRVLCTVWMAAVAVASPLYGLHG
ncbi:hypothetical protein COO60DRAFT_1201348 [Scenedesmus sp. NREL 46B-D3]|nr:hypothetical protein COO60DRAFT_1201348 [Scenedesmus sp. NREL 46B-D3]